MKQNLFFIVVIFIITHLVQAAEPITKIAFGSCLRQNQPQPIWNAINNLKPDLFVFVGDNIYADTTNPAIMQRKYQQLANQLGYQELKRNTPVYAVWDDHDYGQNDAGKENPIKQQAEEIFLDFFDIPKNAANRNRTGIYDVHWFGPIDRRVQLILLDTRYFRGPLIKGELNTTCPKLNYAQQMDPQISILGKQQWHWLEKQLQQPATLRIIVSSIQVIPEQHCWEKWSNFPHEREKLFDLIATTKANGVVFISGDRHLAEISKIEIESIGYTLYEITSSGMNSAGYGKGEQNDFRLTNDNFREDNFGLIIINWENENAQISLQIRNDTGSLLFQKVLSLIQLTANH